MGYGKNGMPDTHSLGIVVKCRVFPNKLIANALNILYL